MRKTTNLIVCVALLLSSSGAFASMDMPSRFLPGIYFEHHAQIYLKHHDYKAALENFQLAGYWANKVAQYNVGIMYFNGIGTIPVDKVRGVALKLSGIKLPEQHKHLQFAVNCCLAAPEALPRHWVVRIAPKQTKSGKSLMQSMVMRLR